MGIAPDGPQRDGQRKPASSQPRSPPLPDLLRQFSQTSQAFDRVGLLVDYPIFHLTS